MSSISMDTPAVDVHAHVGPYDRGDAALQDRFCSGGADAVVARGHAAGVARSIVSSIPAIIPYGGDVLAGNDEAVADLEAHDDLFLWAVLNPLVERSFGQVNDLLAHEKCVGIKIHPTDHGYEIREYGERLFAFAAKHEAIVLTHSGERGSHPEDFVELADRHAPVRLILAHLGNSDDGRLSRQVYALARCRSGNMFVDTSSSASIGAGLIEWAVGELGAERILFGSDSPLYHIACQKARIVYADIEDAAKQAILYDNAARLFVWQNA